MSVKVVTPATEFPISLVEAKAHLRVDDNDNNEIIQSLVGAATEYAMSFMGRALVNQTYQLTLDSFPCKEIKILPPPLQSVESVVYDDAAGIEQTLDPSRYTVDANSEPGWLLPVGSWPSTFSGINAVRIRFIAGYGYDENSPPVNGVPDDIKAAIKLIVGSLYENREDVVVGQSVTKIPSSADWLLRRKRFDLSMA